MAAIPDYVSGATEHWGIITFRETSIFYNSEESSETNKQRVASVVAHELAHQWFGNLGEWPADTEQFSIDKRGYYVVLGE